MSDDAVRLEMQGEVGVIRLDDGKVNALSHEVIDGIREALDRCEKDAGAALILGRPARFSAGFDLATMRAGAAAARGLVTAGAELFLRMLELERPIVVGCTGHAIAAGAILLLSADARLGAEGDAKIGLNEVGIGMSLPIFAFELARARLSKRHFVAATSQARLYSPAEAVDAGYLDTVVDAANLETAALEEATRLAGLPQPAFGRTKRAVHALTVATIRETLAEDMARLTGPSN